MSFELTRGGGPGDRPPIDPELQRQQEQQRAVERELVQEQQLPALMEQLDKSLSENPKVSAYLQRLDPEEQDEFKQKLGREISQRTGLNGLKSIDQINLGKDGSIHVGFNEFRSVFLKPDQVERPAPAVTEPTAQTPPKQAELETRQPPQAAIAPEKAEQHSRPQTSRDQHHRRPDPVALPQEMTPQRGPHLEQRLTDIQQQITPLLDKQLDGYPPGQQQQLSQALTREVSDFAGWQPQIKQISTDDNGLIHVHYNKSGEISLDPQQVLQPERQADIPRPLDPLSIEEQQRQDTQRQIQQQIEHLTQHNPNQQLIMEHRLREAVQDERIESLRMDGEDTFQLGLSNGMVLTATTYELLNMDSGRELLERAQVDPANANERSEPMVITEEGINWEEKRAQQALLLAEAIQQGGLIETESGFSFKEDFRMLGGKKSFAKLNPSEEKLVCKYMGKANYDSAEAYRLAKHDRETGNWDDPVLRPVENYLYAYTAIAQYGESDIFMHLGVDGHNALKFVPFISTTPFNPRAMDAAHVGVNDGAQRKNWKNDCEE